LATVGKLEGTSEFAQLVEQTRLASSRFEFGFDDDARDNLLLDPEAWQEVVSCFFRRSEFYLQLARDQHVSLREYWTRYWRAFTSPTNQVTDLGLIDSVAFAEDRLDFGPFQIERLHQYELDSMLQANVNAVFYPRCLVDPAAIADYWFVIFSRTSSKPDLAQSLTRLWNREVRHAPERLDILMPALQPLVLFNWDTASPYGLPLQIPLVISLQESLLVPPRETPDTPPRRGRDDSYGPEQPSYFRLTLDAQATRRFEIFTRRAIYKLSNLKSTLGEWAFFQNAIGFLTKAYFTKDLDQLVWHIVTLEALFGEDKLGTSRLARRIGAALGKDEGERVAIEEQFRDVHRLRCKIVHGDEALFGQMIPWEKLRVARDLARRSTIWMLNCLNHILARSHPSQLPTRQLILKAIDTRCDLAHTSDLLRHLPSGFPAVPSWNSE